MWLQVRWRNVCTQPLKWGNPFNQDAFRVWSHANNNMYGNLRTTDTLGHNYFSILSSKPLPACKLHSPFHNRLRNNCVHGKTVTMDIHIRTFCIVLCREVPFSAIKKLPLKCTRPLSVVPTKLAITMQLQHHLNDRELRAHPSIRTH